MADFLTDAVLKRDVLSETRKGHFADAPATPLIRRLVSASPIWMRPFAWLLARREIAALRALEGISGTPRLIETDRHGLLRSWSEGTPLHLARPVDRLWYRDAHRLLRDFRRRGVTHNDLAKPQNWLMTPDGHAAVIDFQLASRHRRRGALFRLFAYEDFRHLVKQRRAYAPHLMTPTARRLLRHRTLPSRLWRKSGKKFYNFVTHGVFGWSDGEGTHDRIPHEGAAIMAKLKALKDVRDVALLPFPLPFKGSGIYAFAEVEPGAAPLRGGAYGADLLQQVEKLPRRADGTLRDDLLQLVALNQVDDLQRALAGDPPLATLMRPIMEGRLNLSDRRLDSARVESLSQAFCWKQTGNIAGLAGPNHYMGER